MPFFLVAKLGRFRTFPRRTKLAFFGQKNPEESLRFNAFLSKISETLRIVVLRRVSHLRETEIKIFVFSMKFLFFYTKKEDCIEDLKKVVYLSKMRGGQELKF